MPVSTVARGDSQEDLDLSGVDPEDSLHHHDGQVIGGDGGRCVT